MRLALALRQRLLHRLNLVPQLTDHIGGVVVMHAGLLIPVEHGPGVQQAYARALVVVRSAGAARRLRVFRQYQAGEALPNLVAVVVVRRTVRVACPWHVGCLYLSSERQRRAGVRSGHHVIRVKLQYVALYEIVAVATPPARRQHAARARREAALVVPDDADEVIVQVCGIFALARDRVAQCLPIGGLHEDVVLAGMAQEEAPPVRPGLTLPAHPWQPETDEP